VTSRTTLLKRAAAVLTATGVAIAGAVVLTGVSADAAIKTAETPFAYQGSAFGTRVTAGDPGNGGVASGRTAWSTLGCTAMAPIRHDVGSYVTKVNADSYIKVGAIDSFTSSYRKPKLKIFGSRSVNKVADIVLGQEGGPRLKIGALTTVAHAFNKHGRFASRAHIDLVGVDAIGINPDGSGTPGPLADLLDAIDQGDDQATAAIIEAAGTNGIDIPGVGTVYPAGWQRTPRGKSGATANAYGIRVKLDNGSQVVIGRAWARIQTAAPAGVFSGHAFGLEAEVGQGVLGLGRTPFQPLPCPGTQGTWHENPVAQAPQSPQLNAKGLNAETYGKPNADGSAVARARGSVAHVTIGGGQLEIDGIVGQANVVQNRKGRVVRRTIAGTRIGSITTPDKPEGYQIPAPGQDLEIPGVALIKVGVRQDIGKRGLRVYAVRVELLDGSGLVLNLGAAKARIGR
jgi:hypothetical protein